MRTLYDIEGDWLTLNDMLDESEGEITPEIEAVMGRMVEDLEDETETKLENYCRLILDVTATADAQMEEADRLKRRAQTNHNKAKYLKSRIADFMRLVDKKKMPAGIFTVSRCQNGGLQPLQVDGDFKHLPTDYREEVISYKPARDRIVADLTAGRELPFARLLPRGEHLKIS